MHQLPVRRILIVDGRSGPQRPHARERSMSSLVTFSDELAGAVAEASRSVVAVLGGGRRPQSGVRWNDRAVVTADHALDRDEDIAVVFGDGSQTRATLAGRDASTDLAVLKVDGGAAPAPARAELDSLAIGHMVLAIGRT